MAASVIVVGAGPGGLFSSYLLGRGGLDVTLIDLGDDVSERQEKIREGGRGAGPCYLQPARRHRMKAEQVKS